jgi:selenocysteine lyase/cysteine desulfurase
MIDRLRTELPERGFEVITPKESKAPIITCALPNAYEALGAKLEEANVKISLSRNRFRVTPSVFNDMEDIDTLLAALGKAVL